MKTVLLVDDDVEHRALLRSGFAAHGLLVLEAATGAQADQELDAHLVDIVVSEGRLPDGSGIEWLRRARQRDPMLCTVFLSGQDRDLDTFRHLSEEIGVTLVQYKPIDVARFVDKVSALVRPRGYERVTPERAGASSFQAKLAVMTAAYVEALPNRLTEIELAVGLARSDPALVQEARRLAHRLRGTAGSYGCGSVGEAMAHAEDLLREIERGNERRHLWEDVDSALREARLAIPEPNAQAQPPRQTMLVVGDPASLALARDCARSIPVAILTAQTHAEALQRAESEPLFGALVDLGEDPQAGFDLARQIREVSDSPSLPIAFCSSQPSLEMRVTASRAGGRRFLEKPLSTDGLSAVVHEFLQRSKLGAGGRVLVVDDDPDAIEHYTHHLGSAGVAVEALPDATRLLEQLKIDQPDVLILDVDLPGLSGIEVCRALRASSQWELLPILIATALTDTRTRLQAFRAGASDVLTKPILPEELSARVGVQLDRIRLLRERSDKDPLTGLLHRRSLLDALHRAFAASIRNGQPLSIVLLDIDHFKSINDRFGHPAGDEVLSRLGELLLRRFRTEDLRGRWGGEEFLLAFPGQTSAFGERAALRLLREFSEMRFCSDSFGATFTAGVASYPEDGESIAALIRRADELLYLGKTEGRNRVRMARRGGRG